MNNIDDLLKTIEYSMRCKDCFMTDVTKTRYDIVKHWLLHSQLFSPTCKRVEIFWMMGSRTRQITNEEILGMTNLIKEEKDEK